MNPHSPQQQIDFQAWHHCYRSASGEEVILNFYRESMWREFLHYMHLNRPDFTMNDLSAVIALRKRRKQQKVYGHQSVAFNALIGSPDLVEEDISEARGKQRIAKPDAKQEILRATGRPTEQEKPAQQVKDILKETEALQNLQQFKRDMGWI